MTNSPTNKPAKVLSISVEIERILKHYKEYLTGVYQGVTDYDEVTAKLAIVNLLVDSYQKGYVDGGIAQFNQSLQEPTQ